MHTEQFTKLKVRNILNQARPKGRKALKGRGLLITMSVCLIGTTLSFQAASVFFSMSFIVMLTYSRINSLLRWSFPRAATITAMISISISILSGCGSLLSNSPDELIAFCSDKIGDCNTGSSSTWLICGLPLNNISIEAAQANGQIDEVIGVRNAEGFGLIAVKQITVYGG